MNASYQVQPCCPFLGLEHDQATYKDFPSSLNVCFHTKPEKTPALAHQRIYCLSENYTECPVFSAPKGNKMPGEIQYQQETKRGRNRLLIGITAALILILIFLLGFLREIGWDFLKFERQEQTPLSTTSRDSSLRQFTPTEEPLITATMATATITPTEIMPTSTQTPIPSPSPSATQRPIFALDTPIGADPQFIIHRALPGETLLLFANRYNTSVEAIYAVNLDLQQVLWVDQIVIIPMDRTDLSGIPAFTAYQIAEETTNLEEISDLFSVSLDDLVRFNHIGPRYLLTQGEWILIPQGQP